MNQPSCFNCRHLKTWFHPATWWEPDDYGWECSKGLDEVDFDDDPESDDQQAEWLANQCPSYEYFDWDDYHRAQAEMERASEGFSENADQYLEQLDNLVCEDSWL